MTNSGCFEPGEIMERRLGACWRPKENELALFHSGLEGEVRLHAIYDRQSILMGVIKPGILPGKSCCSWTFPGWPRRGCPKPARIFRTQ